MPEFLDPATRAALEFDDVWDRLRPITPFGLEQKEQARPFLAAEAAALEEELEELESVVGYLAEFPDAFTEISEILAEVREIRGSVSRSLAGQALDTVELFEIKKFLFILKDLLDVLEEVEMKPPRGVALRRPVGLEKWLDLGRRGQRTFYIDDDYSEALRRVRQEKRRLEKEISVHRKRLCARIRAETGVEVRLQGELIVSKAEEAKIEAMWRRPDLAYSGETHTHLHFRVRPTGDIVKLQEELEQLKQEERNEELKVRAMLSQKVAREGNLLLESVRGVGRIDFLLAKARLAGELGCVKPVVTAEPVVCLREGVHPLVRDRVQGRGLKYTPLTVELGRGVTVITGANMSGKTVTLKTVGLLVAMAQHGLFVPCAGMSFSPRNFVRFSGPGPGGVDEGLSTFGAEVRSLREAVARKDERGLILLDELARGTNPREGYAIAAAIAGHLLASDSVSVVTTHYAGLASLPGVVHLQVRGLRGLGEKEFAEIMESIVREELSGVEVIQKHMDYRLERVEGRRAVPHDAINIARLLGLDASVIAMAERLLEQDLGPGKERGGDGEASRAG